MSQSYVGEIRMGGFNFAPKGFALCNGQLLSIQQNAALFSILGTTYGGNGTTTFALPNLQGCTPVHFGTSPSGGGTFVLGQTAGEINHTLLLTETPSHTHGAVATTATADNGLPTSNYWASNGQEVYAATGGATMSGQALTLTGGSQPHPNLPPFLVINFFIALVGIFPTRN